MQHKKEKHGDAWVVLELNNLSAHVAESVKTITDGHGFLVCFPSSEIESTQPIDAGHGRSIRC